MPTASSSKAFTLFELLLVVVLIAVLYGVFVHKLSTPKTAQDANLNLKTLKPFLQTIPFEHKVELLCFEPDCSCHLYIDGKPVEQEAIKLFKTSPKTYRKNSFGQYQLHEYLAVKDEKGRFKTVCFGYNLYPNGSGSSYIVEADERFYYFPPHLGDVIEAESLEQIESTRDMASLLPRDKGDYDF